MSDMLIFDEALERIKSDYEPMIKDARNHLQELIVAYQSRKHALAVEFKYENDVIKTLKLGFDVIKTGYEDGSWWIEIGGGTYCEYDHPEQRPMLEAFDTAEDLGLIEVDDTRGDIVHQYYRLTPPSS